MKGETRNRKQNRQYARKTPNVVYTRREGEREGELKGGKERGVREKVDFVQSVDFVDFDI